MDGRECQSSKRVREADVDADGADGRSTLGPPPAGGGTPAARPLAYNTMAQAYASAALRAAHTGDDHPAEMRRAIVFRG